MTPLLARVETTGALEERHEVSPPRRTASRAITPAAARGQRSGTRPVMMYEEVRDGQ